MDSGDANGGVYAVCITHQIFFIKLHLIFLIIIFSMSATERMLIYWIKKLCLSRTY